MKDWQSQAHVKWDCKYHVVIEERGIPCVSHRASDSQAGVTGGKLRSGARAAHPHARNDPADLSKGSRHGSGDFPEGTEPAVLGRDYGLPRRPCRDAGLGGLGGRGGGRGREGDGHPVPGRRRPDPRSSSSGKPQIGPNQSAGT